MQSKGRSEEEEETLEYSMAIILGIMSLFPSQAKKEEDGEPDGEPDGGIKRKGIHNLYSSLVSLHLEVKCVWVTHLWFLVLNRYQRKRNSLRL